MNFHFRERNKNQRVPVCVEDTPIFDALFQSFNFEFTDLREIMDRNKNNPRKILNQKCSINILG